MIVAAAIQIGDRMFSGSSHDQIIEYMLDKGISKDEIRKGKQGYLTDEHNFLTRREAAQHAMSSGQIDSPVKHLIDSDILWS